MRQIIYFSSAADDQSGATVQGILETSRTLNERDAVTGILIAGGLRYLQLIEGDSTIVGLTLDRIRSDTRHVGVNVIVDRKIKVGNFQSWSMALMEAPDLARYATFQQLVDAMSDAVEPELGARLIQLSQAFAKSPIRPDGDQAAEFKWATH